MIFKTSFEIEPQALAALLPLMIVAAIVLVPSSRTSLMRLWTALWR